MPASPDVFTNQQSTLSLFNARHPFYDTFVQRTGKPFMFSETGSASIYDKPGQSTVGIPVTTQLEVDTKQSWWTAILQDSILAPKNTKISRLKAAVWFEERKDESSYDNPNIMIERDYRITFNESVRRAFLGDMQKLGDKISYAGKFEFKCNGEFTFVR